MTIANNMVSIVKYQLKHKLGVRYIWLYLANWWSNNRGQPSEEMMELAETPGSTTCTHCCIHNDQQGSTAEQRELCSTLSNNLNEKRTCMNNQLTLLYT